MGPLLLLALQIVSSFVVMGLFAALVVAPRLRELPLERALPPLLWIHALRYVPLGLLAPGQIDPEIPLSVARMIAWGDFLSGGLAVLALVALYTRRSHGLVWAWAFTAMSSLDIVVALVVALGNGVYEHPLGVAWYVLTLYVPLVCISQGMIVTTLFRRRPSKQALRMQEAT